MQIYMAQRALLFAPRIASIRSCTRRTAASPSTAIPAASRAIGCAARVLCARTPPPPSPSPPPPSCTIGALATLVPPGCTPSLIKCDKLTVKGAVVLEAGVVFEGKVEIVGAAEGPPKVLKAGTYKDKAYEL